MPTNRPKGYIPALHFDWLTPYYDLLVSRLIRELALKQQLIALADIRSGQRVLDLGCGTGTLALMVKQAHPQVDVTGLDGDEEMLSQARRKADRLGLSIRWEHKLATELPYPSKIFDRVLTSFMIHHLTRPDKVCAFAEIHRVLKNGGELHVLDFGPPHNGRMWFPSLVLRHFERIGDNIREGLTPIMTEAGFRSPRETDRQATWFGTVVYITGTKSP